MRKRKRKSFDQLKILEEQFNADPHWSKQKLALISLETSLSEGQVYKWGWDQKRKKFGVEEAERMRQIEHQLDQADVVQHSQKPFLAEETSDEAPLSNDKILRENRHTPLPSEVAPHKFKPFSVYDDSPQNEKFRTPI